MKITIDDSAVGIVRHMDRLGRIVLPKELRKALGMDNGEAIEMIATKEGILLRKYEENQ